MVFLRRWLALGFVMFCSMLVVVYETSASDKRFFLPEPLGGMKIMLDAGHGGLDGGASNGDVIEMIGHRVVHGGKECLNTVEIN